MTGLKPLFFLSQSCSAVRVAGRMLVPHLLCLWVGLGLIGARVLASEPPLIVVTQKPLALLLSELLEDSATLVQVIPDGASPHEFSLSWSGRRQLADADLVVWGGVTLEPQLASAIATLPADKVLDASTGVVDWAFASDCHSHAAHSQEQAKLPEQKKSQSSESDSDGSAHVEARHSHHNVNHHHSSRCVDPHFWLNPHNMYAIAEILLERLAVLTAIDSAQRHNAGQALLGRIEALDQQAHQILAALEDRFYVVEHDAYNHFSQHYGLRQPGFLRAGHGMPIGPRSFSALLARTDIACVYTEPEYSPKLAQRLAAHTGATLQELDPLGSQLDLALGYTGFMTQFVDTFAVCLALGSDEREPSADRTSPAKE